MPLAVFTSPGPLLFQLGPFSLRWYGLLIAVAVLLGLLLATRLGRQRGIEPVLIADLLPILVLAAVVGARTYYVLFEWRQYQLNWLDAVAVWRGGIAIHGALIGGTLAVILYARWRRIAFWSPCLDKPSALAARAQLPALDVKARTIACRSASVRASLRPHACS